MRSISSSATYRTKKKKSRREEEERRRRSKWQGFPSSSFGGGGGVVLTFWPWVVITKTAVLAFSEICWRKKKTKRWLCKCFPATKQDPSSITDVSDRPVIDWEGLEIERKKLQGSTKTPHRLSSAPENTMCRKEAVVARGVSAAAVMTPFLSWKSSADVFLRVVEEAKPKEKAS